MNQTSKASLGMAEIATSSLEQKLAQWFQRFSEQTSGSPMYKFLSMRVSQDTELINLAKDADPKQPAPNLFFASVHFLLMQNPSEELASYYPSLGGAFDASPRMPFLSMMSETVASRKLVSYKRAIKDMKNDEESSYQGRAKS